MDGCIMRMEEWGMSEVLVVIISMYVHTDKSSPTRVAAGVISSVLLLQRREGVWTEEGLAPGPAGSR